MSKKEILLTIAIPSIPSRMRMNLEPMFSRLMTQIGDRKDVEVVSIMDNKSMSIGKKRHLLHHIAQGKYCAIIDDDDDVTNDFVNEVCSAITLHDGVDVIHYNQEAIIDGVSFLISTDTNAPMNPFDQLPRYPKDAQGNYIPCKRPPWHWCAWRTEYAKKYPFGDSFSGEDTLFATEATKNINSHHKIEKVLHIYKWSSKSTSAPLLPGNANPPVVLK